MNINPRILEKKGTYLYGLNFALSDDILEKFAGVRYVLMQGSEWRAKSCAQKIAQSLLNIDMRFMDVVNLTTQSAYACYRVGNILSMSHGMGCASITKLLHDISRVMYFAGNHDIEYIRIGTSGGIGIDPGVVIMTDETYMPDLTKGYKTSALDQDKIYPTTMNASLNARMLAAQPADLPFKIIRGHSISADDFYLGQARFDGAIMQPYTEDQRQRYFERIQQLSILNMEMESGAFGSFCYRAEIPATMIAVTLLNRVLTDQVTATEKELVEWSNRSLQVVLHYLEREKHA